LFVEPKQKDIEKLRDGNGYHDYMKIIGCNGAQDIENPGFVVPGRECF
jgi:hypothetical protein